MAYYCKPRKLLHYENIKLSQKAQILRELTLNFELIQNHFKWFYLTIMPLFGLKQFVLKATKPSATINKAIAIIAGQYPHNAYAIVGGITSEPSSLDMLKVINYIDETLKYFEQYFINIDTQKLLECDNFDELFSAKGDLPTILQIITDNHWQYLGKSYDRFIVFGGNSYFNSGKSIHTRISKNLNINEVKEFVNKNSYAKNVTYKDKYYETGPLSRAMLNKTPLIKGLHRKFGDSMLTRIVARVCEIPQLLNHSKKLIEQLDLSEPSSIEPKPDISKLTGNGIGIVEAARGSLIHKAYIQNGIIKKYDIITPTQWNLSNGTRKKLAISQKAMIGLKSTKLAEIVFKTFDVCSVCTTH